MSKTLEYKDKAGEWQLTHKAANGNITLSTTEGYKNKKDMQESMINACIQVLDFYKGKINQDQFNKLMDMVDSL